MENTKGGQQKLFFLAAEAVKALTCRYKPNLP